MLRIIFTLDYEIHGNGEGCPRALMVEPTDRLLRLFDEYGARLTIMADAAEILKFREYKEKTGRDDFHYDAIAEQLRSALARGHDVQLHLHSSYFRAHHDQGRWVQEWSEYDFAGLSYDRMAWMIREGKDFLETLLRTVDPAYRCLAFRAANWSVSPSENVVNALGENNIPIDTSVFKCGCRQGIVTFDYSNAHHHLRPWPASANDICCYDPGSRLWEFPIYAEQRRIGYATGVSYALEAGSFSGLNYVAAQLGVLMVAAWSVVLNVAAVVFMIPLGIAAATAVFVARGVGARSLPAVRRAFAMGLRLALAVLAVLSLLVFAAPGLVASAYTGDDGLKALVAPALLLSCLFFMADGAQVVAAQALRARGDTWWPTGMHCVSYLVVMLPLAWVLGVQRGGGLQGIVWAVIVGSFISAAGLMLRFRALGARMADAPA